jgi:hypothetical protein
MGWLRVQRFALDNAQPAHGQFIDFQLAEARGMRSGLAPQDSLARGASGDPYAAASVASSTALVTDRSHNGHSNFCNGECAPKFGSERANRIDVPQCGQHGDGQYARSASIAASSMPRV